MAIGAAKRWVGIRYWKRIFFGLPTKLERFFLAGWAAAVFE